MAPKKADARDQERGGVADHVGPVLEQVEGEDRLRGPPLHKDEGHDPTDAQREQPDDLPGAPRDTPGRRG